MLSSQGSHKKHNECNLRFTTMSLVNLKIITDHSEQVNTIQTHYLQYLSDVATSEEFYSEHNVKETTLSIYTRKSYLTDIIIIYIVVQMW